MWGRKSPIEEYLDKHPDSTLREYNEYVKEEAAYYSRVL